MSKFTKDRFVEEPSKDALTKLLNRASLESQVEVLFNECIVAFDIEHSPQSHYSLILFDIDYFKAINDLFGHKRGDNVLRDMGFVLSQYISSNQEFIGVLGRWGGEEFLIALPYTPTKRAKYIADEIRELVANYPFQDEANSGSLSEHITISLGVSSMDISIFLSELKKVRDSGKEDEEKKRRITELIEQADCAMDYAKLMGRNRVEVFSNYLKAELSYLKLVRDFYFRYSHCPPRELSPILEDSFLQRHIKIRNKVRTHFKILRTEINPRDTRTQAVFADALYKSLLSNLGDREESVSFFKKYLSD